MLKLNKHVMDQLAGQFVAHVEEHGLFPPTLIVLVSEYRYVTPDAYPPRAPERQLVKERTQKFMVQLPPLALNEGLGQAAQQSPIMRKSYWAEVARTIVQDVTFVEVP